MGLKDRIRTAWIILRGQAIEIGPEDLMGEALENPYVDDADALGMMHEALDASIHALWPLISTSAYGGLMAYKGVVHGVLYATTLDEDSRDQDGVAWEVARIVNLYTEPEASAMDMPGIHLGAKSTAENQRVDAELIAFLGAAMDGDFEDAVSVTRSLRKVVGPVLYANGDFEDLAAAEKRAVTEFLGSIMASTATQYVLDTVGLSDAG